VTAPVLRADHSQLRSRIFSCSINKKWVDDLPLILAALRQHFGPKFDPLTAILPSTDLDQLRYELMKISPTMHGIGYSKRPVN
jgi:hypothetical protein